MAAYVLGVLDAEESARFESHLLDCPHCQLDVLELQDLPGVLDRALRHWPRPPLPPAAPEPPPLADLLERAAAQRRGRRRVGRLVAAAAVLLIIAGPLVVLAFASAETGAPSAAPPARVEVTTQAPSSSSPSSPSSVLPAPEAPAAESVPPPTSVAPSPSTSPPASAGSPHLLGRAKGAPTIRAVVELKRTVWGSKVDLELTGVSGPLYCQLVAVTKSDTASMVLSWFVPAKSPRGDGDRKPLRITGATALDPGAIERFEVRTADGLLLSSASPFL